MPAIAPHAPGFTLLSASETGIAFSNILSQSRYTTNQVYLNGSGVTAADVDGDGLCDLFFCGLENGSVLYRNLGNWKFADITASAGVACSSFAATGAAFADIDGDGDMDLIVNSIGSGTHVFLNDGHAHFSESAILNTGRAGMSLALADVDGDGALDLYICNYRTTTLRDLPGTKFRVNMLNGQPVVALVNGQPVTTPALEGRFSIDPHGGIAEHGEPDAFYHNDGSGHFTPISFTQGAFLDEEGKPLRLPPYDWGLSVMFRDLNEDGAPDLYVCNDFNSPDRVWINDDDGRFRALPPLSLRNTSRFSMGIDVADVNRDGHDDLFVLDMLSRHSVTRLTRADKKMEQTPPGMIANRPQFTRNTLQLSRGDGTYAEIAYFAGLAASDWSWTPIFLDVDLDGYEDLLITTGHGRDDMDIDNGMRIEQVKRSRPLTVADELGLRKATPALPSAKLAFRNKRDLHFEETGAAWGFNQPGVSHGMCLADLDNDGDLDVIVNNMNAPAGIYRNDGSGHRVAVRLRGGGDNSRGIGAKIKLFGGTVPLQSQEIICGGRYLSSDDPMRVFAAGTQAMRLEVTWRNGRKTTLAAVHSDRIYEIVEAGSVITSAAEPVREKTLFEDASANLDYQHHEDAFDDFQRQLLLPKRLSRLGPGVAWLADANGAEALAIGSGRGGSIGFYRYDGNQFHSWSRLEKATRDQTTLLGFPDSLLVGESNYEDGMTNGTVVRSYSLSDGTQQPGSVSASTSSIGPMCLGDLDGDGQLELFLGGRVVPGRYPEPASSALYRYQQGHWVEHVSESAVLRNVGLVSGAVWSDLDGDGYPELILACEWAPVKIFANNKGHLREATKEWGMQNRIGWWNGVAAGDFDGDGRMDLAVSNWGLNTKYQVQDGHGPRLYYGPWGGADEIEMLEANFDPELGKWIPERDLGDVGRAIPRIREAFSSHRDYAAAGVEQILGPRMSSARVLEANWLATTVFLNRGDHFDIGILPAAAQFSPAFGVNAADFDGDGNEDIFLSQNFFDVTAQTSRSDAGRGLLLKGDGHGAFAEIPASESGIEIYGEQRGGAIADYDGDGRVDLAVAQNGAAVKLYHNRGAAPGLRIRLNGPVGNPHGVGAVLRIESGGKFGPAREIHSGSGYWSQDSPLQVMAVPGNEMKLHVHWPGGRNTTCTVPSGAKEIAANQDGTLTLIR